jgi:predicted glycoside hydrolase/deacetylase ChbG (UPF0249 family)
MQRATDQLAGGIALITMGALLAAPTAADNLVARLGRDPEARFVILHADDVGMCHAANEAFVELHKAGLVKCGSIMVPCPWFPEIAAFCREHPDHDLGLHLTLTSEWKHYRWRPVTPATDVPGLVDGEGFMWHDERQVVEHATPKEVETEIRAQIALARKFGVEPTHLDSHMGTLFSSPQFFEVYLRVAREANLPPMIPRVSPELLAQYGLKDFRYEPIEQAGYVVLDSLNLGVEGDTLESRFEAYREALSALPPGVSQIILHPAKDGPELSQIAGSHVKRDLDYRLMLMPAMRDLLKELKIQSVGFRELWPLWEQGAGKPRGQ